MTAPKPSFEDFLLNTPPNSPVKMAFRTLLSTPTEAPFFLYPLLQYGCEDCELPTRFNPPASDIYFDAIETVRYFLVYSCANCGFSEKVFAIQIEFGSTPADEITVTKLGEDPAFGPRIPKRIKALVGDDRALLIKGLRCENQGLGVAAYSYYRRVIQNQWTNLLDTLIDIAKKDEATASAVAPLERARAARFAVRSVEDLDFEMPASLLVKGYNPVTLLHAAASDGLHNASDEECLERAHALREVLFELAERIAVAARDTTALSAAVESLAKSYKGAKPQGS